MEKEMMEFFDQKLLVFATKDDVEKLRQEMKVNFRKFTEENKSLIIGWIGETKGEIERLREEVKVEIDSLREDFQEEIKKLGLEFQAALNLSNQKWETFPLKIAEEAKADMSGLKEELGRLGGAMIKTVEEIAALNERIKEGFNEVKEELGAMIKFSYADLEKRLSTLEARVKALEKMVLPLK